MRILVCDDNVGKIAAALTKANGRAVKNMATVADVLRLAERAELQLDIDEMPVSRRGGVEAVWRDRGPLAQSYRYKMTRTRLIIRRGYQKGWYLTGAERVEVYPGKGEEFGVVISPVQRDWIVRHTLEPYWVRESQESGALRVDVA